jgi:glycerate kinase
MTAAEAAGAIAAGVRDAAPDADVTLAPLSDGGPGLVDVMLAARSGRPVETDVSGPLGRTVRARWALLDGGTAVIEMAAASGLVLVVEGERDALRASTRGTGELIRAAADAGAREIVVGAGGSATTDGGAGALQALGVRLLDVSGADLQPGGVALLHLDRIDAAALAARVRTVSLRVATDVTNRLGGPAGAAFVFAPQKGATPDDVRVLDAALAQFAAIVHRDLGVDIAALDGGGAAGGLGAGLAAIGATIEPGFDVVAEAIGLEEMVQAADIVITGEGRLDAQTPFGKAPAGIARMARAHGTRVVALAGAIDESYDGGLFDGASAIAPASVPVVESMRRGPALLRAAAARVIRETL